MRVDDGARRATDKVYFQATPDRRIRRSALPGLRDSRGRRDGYSAEAWIPDRGASAGESGCIRDPVRGAQDGPARQQARHRGGGPGGHERRLQQRAGHADIKDPARRAGVGAPSGVSAKNTSRQGFRGSGSGIVGSNPGAGSVHQMLSVRGSRLHFKRPGLESSGLHARYTGTNSGSSGRSEPGNASRREVSHRPSGVCGPASSAAASRPFRSSCSSGGRSP